MGIYSNSKIATFENCPYKYKLKYIERLKPKIKGTIESFLGDLVHRALEKLYRDLKDNKINKKDELIEYFKNLWKKEFSKEIQITKSNLKEEDYLRLGEKFISDYYDRYFPFNQMTIVALEKKEFFNLPDGNKWYIKIDKLGVDEEKNYFICDYKTGSSIKTQEEAERDRQLAMYSLWVKEKFRDAKKIKLVWHLLAFNKDIISEKNEEQLRFIQREVLEKIKEIENTRIFYPNISNLCAYCEYRDFCPAFRN
ncbi:MAG: PD-(D/E)XK nuclease family protein [Candidatus Pacearchaeota archaeon]